MRFRLVENWHRLIRRSWNLRLLSVVIALMILDAILPIVGYKLPISDISFAILVALVTVAAFIARLIFQASVHE